MFWGFLVFEFFWRKWRRLSGFFESMRDGQIEELEQFWNETSFSELTSMWWLTRLKINRIIEYIDIISWRVLRSWSQMQQNWISPTLSTCSPTTCWSVVLPSSFPLYSENVQASSPFNNRGISIQKKFTQIVGCF